MSWSFLLGWDWPSSDAHNVSLTYIQADTSNTGVIFTELPSPPPNLKKISITAITSRVFHSITTNFFVVFFGNGTTIRTRQESVFPVCWVVTEKTRWSN